MWSTIIEGEGLEQSLAPFAVNGETWQKGGGGLGVRPVYLVSTGKLPPLKTAKKSEAE